MSSKPEEASTARGFLNHISSIVNFRGYIYISKIMGDLKDQYHKPTPHPHHSGTIDGSFPSSINAESSRVGGGRKLKDLRPQPMASHFGIDPNSEDS